MLRPSSIDPLYVNCEVCRIKHNRRKLDGQHIAQRIRSDPPLNVGVSVPLKILNQFFFLLTALIRYLKKNIFVCIQHASDMISIRPVH